MVMTSMMEMMHVCPFCFSDILFKASFHNYGKIPDNQGFHCFLTVPDFAEVSEIKILFLWEGLDSSNLEDW